jgi:hypothetical protein
VAVIQRFGDGGTGDRGAADHAPARAPRTRTRRRRGRCAGRVDRRGAGPRRPRRRVRAGDHRAGTAPGRPPSSSGRRRRAGRDVRSRALSRPGEWI